MNKSAAPDRISRHRSIGGATSFVPPVVLRVDGLIKIYGKRRVVDGVSFQVSRGEIVGLLGPNGAGKTTSFRMACGLINTNGGVVYLGTQDVTHWPMYRRSREGGMGYLPQEKSVFQRLSVQNNLLGVMEMLGIKRSVRKKKCETLLEKLQLTHLRHNYAGGLSGGERRRLEIARSLVSDPKIILLDEPFAAVDPITVSGIQDIIRQLSEEGISILITDHSVQDTLQITQRSYVIQAGKVLCHGTPSEVLSNPEARKVYFGENVNVGNLQSVSLFPESFSPVEETPGSTDEKPVRHSPAHKKHRPHPEPRSAPEPVRPEVVAPLSRPEPPPTESFTVTAEKEPRLKRFPARTVPMTPNVPTTPMKGPGTGENRLDEGALIQAERINRRQHAVSDNKTRPLGRRLSPTGQDSLPERPLVSSNNVLRPEPPTLPTTPTPEPTEGMSGVIRTLGSMIWKK